MKKYNDPHMKISSFNDETVVTNASMQALQDWQTNLNNGAATTTKSVNFDEAVTLIF